VPLDTAETLSEEDKQRLLSLSAYDPHALLGAHVKSGGVVIRAMRVDASAVSVIPDDGPQAGEPLAMQRISDDGLFELVFPDRTALFGYRLRIFRSHGSAAEPSAESFEDIRDPYAFLPSLGELDLHLFGEGRHEQLYTILGAHVRRYGDVEGVAFAVWAPSARGVSLITERNGWDGRLHPMRLLGSSGIWEIFVPGLMAGTLYKYEIRGADGSLVLKTDPFAASMEMPPATASRVYESNYEFKDEAWMQARSSSDPWRSPMSIYELHLGSWRNVGGRDDNDGRPSYRAIAPELAAYCQNMGFTHVELMPVQEHPFDLSWGYQVGGYFCPTARWGTPDDFRFFVDHLHQNGIGVIVDWVPAHFPKDQFALGRFDGTALYEHLDPRQGEHPDWGTYVFNFGRKEVRNFLIASALAWLDQFHIDGLRVDAVASMLYLDYSRKEGQWVPNEYGGRENLPAVDFLRELNAVAHRRHPGVLMVAEESTSWPGVSRPTHLGGLGFGFKWNMGWMHDVLEYFQKEPIHRRYHHNDLTFALVYAWSENFILPFSHDEVVHGKRSMLDKMPGDRWQKFANLRALYGFMWAHPGKKLLFMGSEFGQWSEFDVRKFLDFHLVKEPDHAGLSDLVSDLNRRYLAEPALWEEDFAPEGFRWIDAQNADDNVLAFMRMAPQRGRKIISVSNLSPVPRYNYRVGVPEPGYYREILNTDAAAYGGSDVGNAGGVDSEEMPQHWLPHSMVITIPPLATVWFAVP